MQVTYRTLLSNAIIFRNDCNNKRRFRMHISLLRIHKGHLAIDYTYVLIFRIRRNQYTKQSIGF